MNETRTYELSLTIVSLDRLGHPGDRPTIQLLGLRLLGGQGKNGGWNYDYGYLLSADEESRLKTLFARKSKLVAKVGNPLVNYSQPNAQNPASDRKIAAEMIPLQAKLRGSRLTAFSTSPKRARNGSPINSVPISISCGRWNESA